MTVISIIAINALFSIFAVGALSIFWAWSKHFLSKTMTVWVTHLGYHVGEESQRSDHLVRWTTWTWSSWDLHTVSQPMRCVCDECPCRSANQTRSYSRRIWSPMIVAIVSCRWVALFPHLDACCEWRSTCCNFLQVAQSMPIAPKLELNTTKKINAQPCA
jgi:hypothetical protein